MNEQETLNNKIEFSKKLEDASKKLEDANKFDLISDDSSDYHIYTSQIECPVCKKRLYEMWLQGNPLWCVYYYYCSDCGLKLFTDSEKKHNSEFSKDEIMGAVADSIEELDSEIALLTFIREDISKTYFDFMKTAKDTTVKSFNVVCPICTARMFPYFGSSFCTYKFHECRCGFTTDLSGHYDNPNGKTFITRKEIVEFLLENFRILNKKIEERLTDLTSKRLNLDEVLGFGDVYFV